MLDSPRDLHPLDRRRRSRDFMKQLKQDKCLRLLQQFGGDAIPTAARAWLRKVINQ